MRILLCSHVFPPHIGGIETVGAILAEQWANLGASVTVVTQTPGKQAREPYEIVRQPSPGRLRNLAKDADLVFQNNISLRTLLPLLPSRKPIVISHHGMLRRADRTRGWRERFKCAMLSHCDNVAISKAVARALPVQTTLIYDPFDPREFAHPQTGERDIVFMGRLVPDKGCHLILRALAILKNEGIRPMFSVIGDGPEMPSLRRMTTELGLSDQVFFTGILREGRGQEVAQHKIMVIPSLCEEAFGVVALEGLAAGCAIASSDAGGLPEAVGRCGLLFPNGEVEALTARLRDLLTNSSLRARLVSESERHLEKFRPEVIAKQYLELFEKTISC